MHEYRVTKYNPALRTAAGAYSREEWHRFCHIGEMFDGRVFTLAEYQQVESAYIKAALTFMRSTNVERLSVCGLENSARIPLSFTEGDELTLEQSAGVLRSLLREDYWCKLETLDAFIHVGWDYYLYIGVSQPTDAARREAEALGLYMESFPSPYRPRG
ncbi:MAG TPA: hypothetical protein VGE52_10090 [Pirellulales bacterium]